MQQTPQSNGQRTTKELPLLYFLGTGLAIGVGGIGSFLSVFLHNPVLGLSIGLVIGIALGFLLAQIVRAVRK